MHNYPKDLYILISMLKKLPGVGKKTAERFAFQLLKWEDETLYLFSKSIQNIKKNIKFCKSCGCIQNEGICLFCNNKLRKKDSICILSSPRDVFVVEQTNSYKGLYFILPNLLSPMDGFNYLDLNPLKKKIQENNVNEIILALDSTLEGDATALYIKEEIKNDNLLISRLAFGLPVGSPLDYIDEATLATALNGRQKY